MLCILRDLEQGEPFLADLDNEETFEIFKDFLLETDPHEEKHRFSEIRFLLRTMSIMAPFFEIELRVDLQIFSDRLDAHQHFNGIRVVDFALRRAGDDPFHQPKHLILTMPNKCNESILTEKTTDVPIKEHHGKGSQGREQDEKEPDQSNNGKKKKANGKPETEETARDHSMS